MKYVINFLFLFVVINYSAQPCNTYFTTYCGDDGSDDMKGIAQDQQNNTYCIYQTNSASLTTTPSAITATFSGFYDAYITKFDSCGNLLWATYLGTSGFESGEKIALSPDGNIVFTGYSSANGLPTLAAFQPTNNGSYDCFVGKISPTGNLIWLTYFGKSGGEFAYDIKTDASGNIFIGGTTTSTNLATSGAFQTTHGGGMEAYIAKFNSNGILQWCTYFGGSSTEDIHALTVDNVNNVIGVGESNSFNLSTSPGCIQSTKNNQADIYIIKLDNNGNRIFSTYFGGNGIDDCNGLTTDNTGNIYLGAQTKSTDFTVTATATQTTLAGNTDMLLAKFSPTGALLYSSYFGGIDNDIINRAQNYNNKIYFIGSSASPTMPVIAAGSNSVLLNQQNHFIITTDYNCNIQMAKYYGGSGNGTDASTDLAISKNTIALSGNSTSTVYPVSSGAYQTIWKGNTDGVLTKIAYTNTLSTVNLKFNEKESFDVFPNPTSSEIYIQTTKEITFCKLIDLNGKIILESKNENKIYLNTVPSGIYFITTNLGVKKIIILPK
ncbi:MAG: SBBP repeat-containing protein [Bacteroidetes bacterium]|nr:SBBP repeat-containing protein [Bacteroidota bacterium]